MAVAAAAESATAVTCEPEVASGPGTAAAAQAGAKSVAGWAVAGSQAAADQPAAAAG